MCKGVVSPMPLQEADEEGLSNFDLAPVFKYEQLQKATNSFDTELGVGGYGRVYLGTLPDGRKVAVKVLFDPDPKQRLAQFFKEVTVLSRLRHENLVSFYGCTSPHNQELLLVYDYVPKGTVAEHLHGPRSDLNLALRIQIAVETAEGLTYLHALKPPIIHRDVKTSNILLDNDFHAKVADLGISRFLDSDSTHVYTVPQGTMGYRDPEYERFFRLSDKTDVYSFGVVLMELITGQKAVDVNRFEDIYLDSLARVKILNKQLKDFVDPKLEYNSSRDVKRVIKAVAQLAHGCLHVEGRMRPSMEEVLSALKMIQNKMLEIGHNVVDVMSFGTQRDLAYGNLNNEIPEIMKRAQMGLNKVDVISSDRQRELSYGSLALNTGAEAVLPNLGGSGGDGNVQKKPAGDETPRQPQASTILLNIKRHCECEACTEEIVNFTTNFEGVENVIVGTCNDQLTITGTMDMEILSTLLQEKLKYKADFVTHKKDDDDSKSGEEKTVLLKIGRHCECGACTKLIKETIIKNVIGVKEVKVETDKDLVIVKGTMDMKTLPILLQEKFLQKGKKWGVKVMGT